MSPDEIATIDESQEVEVAEVPRTYWLPDRVYVALKWTALVALPAVGTFYQALAGIWGLPLAEEVSQTASVVALLLGTLIGASAIANQVRK